MSPAVVAVLVILAAQCTLASLGDKHRPWWLVAAYAAARMVAVLALLFGLVAALASAS